MIADGVCIGIIENEPGILNRYRHSIDYHYQDVGYWWHPCGSMGAYLDKDKIFTKQYAHYNLQDVIVGMKLNLEAKKLSYSIDGDDYVNAPMTVEPKEYRLAVTILSMGDEIELL